MMFPVTRLFESEQAAREAVEKLVAGKVSRADITIINAYDPGAAAAVDTAVERGAAMSGHRRALKEALTRGRSIVAVTPDYGRTSFVRESLARSGAVETDTLSDYVPDDPAPFSDMLGLPVLTSGRSTLDTLGLFDFDKETSFGLSLLSRKATPFSSLFGLKTLSSKKGSIAKGSSVEKMSGKPAPFSSMFGLKLLSSKKRSRAKG